MAAFDWSNWMQPLRYASVRTSVAAATLAFGTILGSGADAQTSYRFGKGAGEVKLPGHYVPDSTSSAASLAVVTQPHGNVRLSFDLHKLDSATRERNPGEAFVRERARATQKNVSESGGKVGFVERGRDVVREGRQYVNMHWQIGFGATLVVMSALIPNDAREAEDVRRFFGGELDEIIGSMRRLSD